MVGENIQNLRSQVRNMRSQMMPMKLGDKLFSPNPGILTNAPWGKRMSNMWQMRKNKMDTNTTQKVASTAPKGSTSSSRRVVSV